MNKEEKGTEESELCADQHMAGVSLSCSMSRYENVFGVLPGAVKTLSMESWTQNAFRFMVLHRFPFLLSFSACLPPLLPF